jgi:hypothetical protein
MRITTREQAIEDLSIFGIKEPYTYLLDIVPLIEMIWADGEAHDSELAILDEYLHKRVQQINWIQNRADLKKSHGEQEGASMKSAFFRLRIGLVIILVLGCSSIKSLTQGEIGQPISTVIDRLGPASRVHSDGNGGTVYIWEQWFPTGYGGKRLWSNTYFVDSNGFIYEWR